MTAGRISLSVAAAGRQPQRDFIINVTKDRSTAAPRRRLNGDFGDSLEAGNRTAITTRAVFATALRRGSAASGDERLRLLRQLGVHRGPGDPSDLISTRSAATGTWFTMSTSWRRHRRRDAADLRIGGRRLRSNQPRAPSPVSGTTLIGSVNASGVGTPGVTYAIATNAPATATDAIDASNGLSAASGDFDTRPTPAQQRHRHGGRHRRCSNAVAEISVWRHQCRHPTPVLRTGPAAARSRGCRERRHHRLGLGRRRSDHLPCSAAPADVSPSCDDGRGHGERGLLDFETATNRTIVVRASDGTTAGQTSTSRSFNVEGAVLVGSGRNDVNGASGRRTRRAARPSHHGGRHHPWRPWQRPSTDAGDDSHKRPRGQDILVGGNGTDTLRGGVGNDNCSAETATARSSAMGETASTAGRDRHADGRRRRRRVIFKTGYGADTLTDYQAGFDDYLAGTGGGELCRPQLLMMRPRLRRDDRLRRRRRLIINNATIRRSSSRTRATSTSDTAGEGEKARSGSPRGRASAGLGPGRIARLRNAPLASVATATRTVAGAVGVHQRRGCRCRERGRGSAVASRRRPETNQASTVVAAHRPRRPHTDLRRSRCGCGRRPEQPGYRHLGGREEDLGVGLARQRVAAGATGQHCRRRLRSAGRHDRADDVLEAREDVAPAAAPCGPAVEIDGHFPTARLRRRRCRSAPPSGRRCRRALDQVVAVAAGDNVGALIAAKARRRRPSRGGSRCRRGCRPQRRRWAPAAVDRHAGVRGSRRVDAGAAEETIPRRPSSVSAPARPVRGSPRRRRWVGVASRRRSSRRGGRRRRRRSRPRTGRRGPAGRGGVAGGGPSPTRRSAPSPACRRRRRRERLSRSPISVSATHYASPRPVCFAAASIDHLPCGGEAKPTLEKAGEEAYQSRCAVSRRDRRRQRSSRYCRRRRPGPRRRRQRGRRRRSHRVFSAVSPPTIRSSPAPPTTRRSSPRRSQGLAGDGAGAGGEVDVMAEVTALRMTGTRAESTALRASVRRWRTRRCRRASRPGRAGGAVG